VRWLTDLVPSNVVRASADGAILPLIVVGIAFGVASQRTPSGTADVIARGAGAVRDTILVILRWILRVAPLGVFALVFPVARTLGLTTVRLVAAYIGAVAIACLVNGLVTVIATVVLARLAPARYLQLASPAVAVAFGARSSMAAVPVIIQDVAAPLAWPAAVTSVVLPLVASLCRLGSLIGMIVGVSFASRLYGIVIAPGEAIALALIAVAGSIGVPGVPASTVLVMAPVLTSLGVPAEGLGILLGMDVVPDMFRSAANAVGFLAISTILASRKTR
jgi:Na+/H+-dicarboxylate symporter